MIFLYALHSRCRGGEDRLRFIWNEGFFLIGKLVVGRLNIVKLALLIDAGDVADRSDFSGNLIGIRFSRIQLADLRFCRQQLLVGIVRDLCLLKRIESVVQVSGSRNRSALVKGCDVSKCVDGLVDAVYACGVLTKLGQSRLSVNQRAVSGRGNIALLILCQRIISALGCFD